MKKIEKEKEKEEEEEEEKEVKEEARSVAARGNRYEMKAGIMHTTISKIRKGEDKISV